MCLDLTVSSKRSEGELWYEVPCFKSTVTVYAVRWRSWFCGTIIGISRASSRFAGNAMQMYPLRGYREIFTCQPSAKPSNLRRHLVCLIIQAIFSVVHWLAEIIRSPSFSLFSSSMTTRNSPAEKLVRASSIVSNAKDVRLGGLGIWVGRHVAVVNCLRGALDLGVDATGAIRR
jgi:hypothetical protein